MMGALPGATSRSHWRALRMRGPEEERGEGSSRERRRQTAGERGRRCTAGGRGVILLALLLEGVLCGARRRREEA